jgi:hypothetical protein
MKDRTTPAGRDCGHVSSEPKKNASLDPRPLL